MNGSATDRRRHTCIRLAMWCGRAAVNASVDCLRCQAAPTASTSPLSRGLCRAHRWVHSRDQIPGRSARRFVRVLEHVTILLSPGSQDREPFGEEPPGVWTVICPGKQHFANLLDSSRPARGLIHTEEVTGSIPVSPTRSEAMSVFIKDHDGSHSCSASRYAAGHGGQAWLGRRQHLLRSLGGVPRPETHRHCPGRWRCEPRPASRSR